MSGKKVLLQLILILFLSLPAANTDRTIYSKLEPSAGNLLTDTMEGEINLNYNGEYRDGLIDNFDNFVNPGYPAGYSQIAENTGVDEYAQ